MENNIMDLVSAYLDTYGVCYIDEFGYVYNPTKVRKLIGGNNLYLVINDNYDFEYLHLIKVI